MNPPSLGLHGGVEDRIHHPVPRHEVLADKLRADDCYLIMIHRPCQILHPHLGPGKRLLYLYDDLMRVHHFDDVQLLTDFVILGKGVLIEKSI